MISKNTIKLIHSLELKKNRRSEGLFVAEGPKVVGDLMRHGMRPTRLIATREWTERLQSGDPHGADGLTAPVDVATGDELRRASLLQHPQQVIGLFPLPDTPDEADSGAAERELCLALDGVQDPGNVGTILRLADWFGLRTVFCSHDTADIYNPKVVQATMGSIARVRVAYTDMERLFDRLPATVPVYGTLLDGNNIYTQELTPTGIVVMGNEGKGISPSVRSRINRKLLIPRFADDGAESLNVAIATAVVCSEFKRRQ